MARTRVRLRKAVLVCAAIILAALLGLVVATLPRSPSQDPQRVQLTQRPPVPPVNIFRPLTPAQAAAANQQIATSTEPVEPARPFLLPRTVTGEISRATALDCLTAAVYYEAASETLQGQRAVAQVVLNRVRHPAFPKSVCGVVYQGSERATGCQFTFTCDGSLSRHPSRSGWDRASAIAAAALNGFVERSVGTATHYHTVFVLPYWASSLTKLTTIGAHIFYRWAGPWGRRAAFTGRYAGEPTEAALETAQLPLPTELPEFDDTTTTAPEVVTRLVADESKASLKDAITSTRSAVAADTGTGRPIADERSGVLRMDQAARETVPTGTPQ